MGCRPDGEDARPRHSLGVVRHSPGWGAAPDSLLAGAGRTVINVEWAATRGPDVMGMFQATRVAVVVVGVGVSQPARTSSPAARRM